MGKKSKEYSGLAILSFIVATISIILFLFRENFKTFGGTVPVLLIVSLFTGIYSLKNIDWKKTEGKWMAILGVLISGIGLLLIILLVASVYNPS